MKENVVSSHHKDSLVTWKREKIPSKPFVWKASKLPLEWKWIESVEFYCEQNHHKASPHKDNVPHVLFDYHSECKGGNTKNLEKLRQKCRKQLEDFGFFAAHGNDIVK